ncbi:MAG: amidohydrolase [Pseudomonadota bacterium]
MILKGEETMRTMAKWMVGGALMLAAAGAYAAERPADTIFLNGQVYTPGGWAEAVAVRDGLIVAVGDAQAVDRFKGGASKLVDLKGATLLPGLHDMHVHVQMAGLQQFTCGFAYGAKPAEIAARIKQCADKAKPGDWIVGGNWVGAVFAKGQQTAAFLDKVSPNNPVLLSDESHHSSWVNSKALALAGITRETKNPAGGVIERDAKGNPTGVLREYASFLAQRVLPEPTDDLKRKAVSLAARQMLAQGITSFTDALVATNNMKTMSDLSGEGVIKQRVRGCVLWAPGDRDAERLIETRAAYAKPRFKPDCVKFLLDGVPTESHTAAMVHPYPGTTADDPKAKGILMVPQPALNDAAARFDRMGLHMKFHAAGDGSVRAAIDAVDYARKTNGWGGSAHEVAHNSFVDRADVARVRPLGMTWEFSPYIWYPTPIVSVDVRRAVGDEMLERFTPIKEGVDSGANVVAGSDWPVVPLVNPWLAIETMVTRQSPGGGTDSIGPGERVTVDQAIRIFTENGAKLMGDRDMVGSIEPGMRADIIVVDRNPFKVPVTEIHETKVRMTFIDGERVYDAANPPVLIAE